MSIITIARANDGAERILLLISCNTHCIALSDFVQAFAPHLERHRRRQSLRIQLVTTLRRRLKAGEASRIPTCRVAAEATIPVVQAAAWKQVLPSHFASRVEYTSRRRHFQLAMICNPHAVVVSGFSSVFMSNNIQTRLIIIG